MYREEKWENGWLYIKSTPDGHWRPAEDRQVISWLAERVSALETRLACVEEV